MSNRKTKIAIAIDPQVLKDLDRVVKAEGRSRSSWIERVIRERLGEEVALVHALSNPILADAITKVFGSPEVVGEVMRMVGESASPAETKAGAAAVREVGEKLQKSVERARARKGGR